VHRSPDLDTPKWAMRGAVSAVNDWCLLRLDLLIIACDAGIWQRRQVPDRVLLDGVSSCNP